MQRPLRPTPIQQTVRDPYDFSLELNKTRVRRQSCDPRTGVLPERTEKEAVLVQAVLGGEAEKELAEVGGNVGLTQEREGVDEHSHHGLSLGTVATIRATARADPFQSTEDASSSEQGVQSPCLLQAYSIRTTVKGDSRCRRHDGSYTR